MASLQFQIHTDKENPTSAGVKKVAGVQGTKAKFFQAHKTPRRALGSVNEANRVGGRSQQSNDLKNGTPMLPSVLKQNSGPQKDSKTKGQQPDKENVVRAQPQEEKGGVHTAAAMVKQQQQQSVSYCLPDIEYMPPASPRRDDDDTLPSRKRTSTYVHKFLSWRPPCFYGTVADSEEEEEEEKELQRIMHELDNLPQPKEDDIFPPARLRLSCDELDVDCMPLPCIDDLTLPYIDDIQEASSGDDTVRPTLDDSVGLVPHLGSLEFLDNSLPSLPQQ
ncbi:hypothetical protein ACOMHN_065177 [Nucella lapillus]